MTKYLRAVPNQPIQFPYTLSQLQADILEETSGATTVNLGVDPLLLAEEPFYFFPYSITTPPEVNARTERLEPNPPTLTPNGWEQTWTIREATPEELELFDRLNAPPAEWIGFQEALSTSATTNALLAACLSPQAVSLGGPTLFGGLVAGLSQVATGGASSTFLTAWRGAMMAGLVTQEVAEEVFNLAQPFNLPEDFVLFLLP